jgi:orotidine-5'-phosphate decarboxylase
MSSAGFSERLIDQIKIKKSYICIGLDPSFEGEYSIPEFMLKESKGNHNDAIFEFNKQIIDATYKITPVYKPQFAFYEQYDAYHALKKTIEYAHKKNCLIIADAKRNDIGNTSKAYAKSVFDYFQADSITANPYMGYDSLLPFFEHTDKLVFILALTSNPGSENFQKKTINGKPLYQLIIEESMKWGTKFNTGFVVGATNPEELVLIRDIAPDNLLLIPGIGAQGGDIEAIMKANKNGLAIINVSRAVIYSSSGKDYDESAAIKVNELNNIINSYTL